MVKMDDEIFNFSLSMINFTELKLSTTFMKPDKVYKRATVLSMKKFGRINFGDCFWMFIAFHIRRNLQPALFKYIINQMRKKQQWYFPIKIQVGSEWNLWTKSCVHYLYYSKYDVDLEQYGFTNVGDSRWIIN